MWVGKAMGEFGYIQFGFPEGHTPVAGTAGGQIWKSEVQGEGQGWK